MRAVDGRTNEELFVDPEVVQEYASFDFLLPAERALLDDLPAEALEGRVLDLGVGGGRTTAFLAPRSARYTGVDLSPAMVRACVERFATLPAGTFRTGDARALTGLADASFDLVVFAFQGIDSVLDHGERQQVLREVARVTAEGGWFVFSSDNLHAHRRRRSWTAVVRRLPHGPRAVQRSWRHVRRLRALGDGPPGRSPHAVVTILRDLRERPAPGEPARTIAVAGYAVEPREQLRQLDEAGFGAVRLYLPDGTATTDPRSRGARRAPAVYYVARRRGSPG